ncbi:ATP-binding protein [Limnovirga soli]
MTVNWWLFSFPETLADTILDRIVHQSIRIELCGEFQRKKQKGTAETMQ